MVITPTEKTRLGFKMEVTITHMQRLEIRLLGKAFVGYRARDGWRQSLPFYAFRCPVHGYVEDYREARLPLMLARGAGGNTSGRG